MRVPAPLGHSSSRTGSAAVPELASGAGDSVSGAEGQGLPKEFSFPRPRWTSWTPSNPGLARLDGLPQNKQPLAYYAPEAKASLATSAWPPPTCPGRRQLVGRAAAGHRIRVGGR